MSGKSALLMTIDADDEVCLWVSDPRHETPARAIAPLGAALEENAVLLSWSDGRIDRHPLAPRLLAGVQRHAHLLVACQAPDGTPTAAHRFPVAML